MSALLDASLLIQAFLFKTPEDAFEEFRPLKIDIHDSMGALCRTKATDPLRFICTCLTLHIYLQSLEFMALAFEEIQVLRCLVGELFAFSELEKYATFYKQSATGTKKPSDFSSHLLVFDDPLDLSSALLQLLKGQKLKVECPFCDLLITVGAVDVDAVRWLQMNVLGAYKLIVLMTNSLANGSLIDESEFLKGKFEYLKAIGNFKLEIKEVLANCLPKHLHCFLLTKDAAKLVNADRIKKGYLNPSWDWSGTIPPAIRYAFEYLRVDKTCDLRHLKDEDVEMKGSQELSCFHSQFMNRLCGRLFGLAPLLFATFPPILPDKMPSGHFNQTIKLNGLVQQPLEPISQSLKDCLMFCVSVNESLRLLNDHNVYQMDAVWIFRNRPEPMNSGFGGLLFALGLLGLLKELPMVAIMDILKCGNKNVQCGLLLGLGCSMRGSNSESVEGVLAMHIRSHYLNSQRIQLTADIQGIAALSLGFLYYNSCDRQVLKILFSEFERTTSIHEKSTQSYPASYYLASGCAIGLVSSGNIRGCLGSRQLDWLLSAANGHLRQQVILEIPALICLCIGAAGTGDGALANCISLDDKRQVRPLHWFYRHLARLLIEWPDNVLICDTFTDEYSYYEVAAQFYYVCLRFSESQYYSQLMSTLNALNAINLQCEGVQFKRLRMAIDFAIDACLMSLAIHTNGQADGVVIRELRRHFHSLLDYNFGRSTIHSMALGFACMQQKKLDLSTHFSLSAILLSILPCWSRDFTDSAFYMIPLRYLWVMACTDALPRTAKPRHQTFVTAKSDLLQNFAIFKAFQHNQSPFSETQLATIFKQ